MTRLKEITWEDCDPWFVLWHNLATQGFLLYIEDSPLSYWSHWAPTQSNDAALSDSGLADVVLLFLL